MESESRDGWRWKNVALDIAMGVLIGGCCGLIVAIAIMTAGR